MMKYGLILGVVGTFVCVTAVTPSLPSSPSSPCHKEVEEVCGTDGMTDNNLYLIDQVHTGDVKDRLSLSGSCGNETVQHKNNTKTSVKNVTENVVKLSKAVDELKDENKTAQYLSNKNDEKTLQEAHRDVNAETIIANNSEDSSQTEDTSDAQPIDFVNKTIPKTSDEVRQPQTIKLPIVEKIATTEEKNISNATSSNNGIDVDNDQKSNNKKNKVESVEKNITINNEKSEDVKKPGTSRKRRDVKNVADANDNDSSDTNNEGKVKVTKNNSEKSKKQKHNVENSQPKTESKVEQRSKTSKNKLENSRKRRDVQNTSEVKETRKNNQAETKYKGDTKNDKNKQTQSDKQKGQYKSHSSRKHRDIKGKNGKKYNIQKTQHSRRTDRKMKKGSQNS